MRKNIINLIMLLLINILIAVYLKGIAIFNVVPAINLIFLTVYAANSKENEAGVLGFILGAIVDIFFSTTFGYNTLMYMYIGVLSSYIAKKFLSNEPLTVLIILIANVIIYDLITFLFFLMFNGDTHIFKYIMKIVVPEVIYTSIVYIPLQAGILKYKRMLKKL